MTLLLYTHILNYICMHIFLANSITCHKTYDVKTCSAEYCYKHEYPDGKVELGCATQQDAKVLGGVGCHGEEVIQSLGQPRSEVCLCSDRDLCNGARNTHSAAFASLTMMITMCTLVWNKIYVS